MRGDGGKVREEKRNRLLAGTREQIRNDARSVQNDFFYISKIDQFSFKSARFVHGSIRTFDLDSIWLRVTSNRTRFPSLRVKW